MKGFTVDFDLILNMNELGSMTKGAGKKKDQMRNAVSNDLLFQRRFMLFFFGRKSEIDEKKK